MTRFADGPTVDVSVSIDAPVAVVWDLVTDINLPARFQDEFFEAEWIDRGPGIEARFLGRNRRGERTWETTSWVVVYEPMKAFGWAVSDRENPGATWTYILDETDDTTVLRFNRVVGPGPSGVTSAIERQPDREEEIIADRDDQHRRNMQAVLDGIKQLAEDR
ncbi:MAG: SRPBCC family protein [Acidimicrobiia bacterium]|nr:MAG: SRPBCC family protein [Acidimicrobiia bacterium]